MFNLLSGLTYLFSHQAEIVSLDEGIVREIHVEDYITQATYWVQKRGERAQHFLYTLFPNSHQTALRK